MRVEANFKLAAAGLVVLALVVTAAWYLGRRMEGSAPVIQIESPGRFVGRAFIVKGRVTEKGMGLKSLKIVMASADGKSRDLWNEKFPAPGFRGTGAVMEKSFAVAVTPVSLGFSDGAATITVTASDHSYRGWGNGNVAAAAQPVTIDTVPPVASVLTQACNVNQGGVGFIIYRLSENTAKDGVLVGDHFFPGHAGLFPNEPLVHGCFFAVAFNQGPGTPMTVEAVDAAGNKAVFGFPQLIRGKRFHTENFVLSDRFISTLLPKFPGLKLAPGTPDTPVNRFLAINRDLRRANYAALTSLGAKSVPRILWSGAFERMSNAAPKANFADHRVYVYDGKTVDEQDHLGVDLASLAQAPVRAANSGRVVQAGDMGIFGLTVTVDHGFGLLTHDSHLSRIDAKVGQDVKKGDVLGASGATGLAGGDHLHYGVIMGDVFVNPIEWWDPHWIKDNVTGKIAEVAAGFGGKTDVKPQGR